MTEYEYDANGNLLNKKTYATDTSAETDESDLETDAENSTESGSSDSDTEETDDISEPTEITRYTYDNFNRLTIFSNSGEFAEYEYDAADYRIRKRVVSGEEDVTGYFYEGGNVSFEADQKGNITNHNVYGTNLLLRSDTETEKSHYYLYNAHGDVVRLTQTDTGDTAAEYRYDAFGNITYSTGDADNAITYAGYQYDAESGLYYVNARYYDSSTGRFITEDTYEGKYTDPLSLNRYTYCHNNPTRYTDPTGHAILPLIVGFGKFALGATFGAGMELFNQVFIEKRDKIGWGEVAFEGFAGGVGALAGAGSADGVIRATTKIGKAKAAVKTVTKAGCVDGAIGFTADVGKQALVEGKSLDEIDYGQAAKTGAISGVAGMGGAAFDMVADGTTALAKGVTRNADNAAESAGDAVRKGQHPKAKQNSPDADAPAHIKGMDEDVDTTGMGDRDVDTTGMGDQDVDTTGMGDAPAGTILSSPEPQKEIRETVEVAEEIHPDPAEEAAARAQAEAELNARRQAAMQSAQSKTIVGYGNDVAGEMSAGYRAEYQAFTSKGSGYTVPADMAGGACFVSGTQIKTDSGNKCIEEIHVGDFVYAKNTYTGEAGWKKVVRLFIKETTELIHIGLSGEVIDTTPTHPFWVDGYGFKAAEELKAGDYVETASGELLRIDHVEKEYLNTPVTVYNFEVEDWHTYYVSGEEILVHNMCMMTPGGGSTSARGVGNSVKVEGRGNTGRIIPNTLEEQIAMKQVQSNPLEGATKIPLEMNDPRWLASEGWVKMQSVVKNADGTKTTIHYVYNEIMKTFDDFKFK